MAEIKTPKRGRDQRLKNKHFLIDPVTGKSQSSLMTVKNGCYHWRNATISKYGTVSVRDFSETTPGKRRSFTVNSHLLAFFVFKKQLPTRTINVSHLCSDRRCVKPSHLVLEPQTVNIQRVKCRKHSRCQGHDSNEACIFPNAKVN